jgi:tetratricopeptide (TPR) repeat protein
LEYNIGTALYKDGKYEEAFDKLQKALVTEDIQYEADAHYNQGNVHYQMGNYQEAIKAYQKSLELNPEDLDAKFNLELARKMLKEQLKPEKQEQQQQQQQEQQQQPQPQDEEQQQQQQQEEEQENNEEQQQQQQQTQQMDENEMSKEDAERILNALKDDEKEIQENQKRFRGKGGYQGNDW